MILEKYFAEGCAIFYRKRLVRLVNHLSLSLVIANAKFSNITSFLGKSTLLLIDTSLADEWHLSPKPSNPGSRRSGRQEHLLHQRSITGYSSPTTLSRCIGCYFLVGFWYLFDCLELSSFCCPLQHPSIHPSLTHHINYDQSISLRLLLTIAPTIHHLLSSSSVVLDLLPRPAD